MPVATRSMSMSTMAIVLRRDEIRGLAGAFTPEEFLELGHPDTLPLLARYVQAVLVDEHLGVLEPLAPRGLGDGVEHLLAELAFERGFLEAFRLLAELDALNGSRHVARNLAVR